MAPDVELDVDEDGTPDVFKYYREDEDAETGEVEQTLVRTEIDLTGESSGLLPSRAWKRRARRQPWYPGETLIMGIGQGYFLTTPLQLAAATAAVANNGTFYTPRVVDYLRARGGGEITPIPPGWNTRSLNAGRMPNWRAVDTCSSRV